MPAWSDCLYDTPPLEGGVTVATFEHGVYLTCTGVRHIHEYHGFNSETETCIYKVVDADHRSTSDSNSNNWLYLDIKAVSDPEIGEFFLKGYVVVSKASDAIVTAYVDPNDDWDLCASDF